MRKDSMLKILILTALPQEYSPLKKLIPTSWQLICRKPFKQFSFSLPGKELRLVETGMGEEAVGEALKWAFAQMRPDLLLFAGFCGGLHSELLIGDVCIVEKTIAFPGSGDGDKGALIFRFPDQLRMFAAEQNLRAITAVTIGSPENKATLAEYVAGDLGSASQETGESGRYQEKDRRPGKDSARPLAGVDMETHLIAGIVRREQVPFLCFRSVSDDLHSDLGFDLGDITGPGGKVKVGRVLKTIVCHPSTLKAFFVAWRRSVKAARNLCEVLAAFLSAPGDSLNRIARGIRIECD